MKKKSKKIIFALSLFLLVVALLAAHFEGTKETYSVWAQTAPGFHRGASEPSSNFAPSSLPSLPPSETMSGEGSAAYQRPATTSQFQPAPAILPFQKPTETRITIPTKIETQSSQNNEDAKVETKITTTTPQTGNIQLSTEAGQQATQVEYYSQRRESTTKTYLGTAEKQKVSTKNSTQSPTSNTAPGGEAATTTQSGTTTWNLQVDSKTRIPTGEYQVSAEVKKADGSTEIGKPTEVRVEHTVPNLTSEEKVKLARSQADGDQDGVTDAQEITLGTNPSHADSDNDGFLDGDEIKNGFNPMQFSGGDKSDKKKFETPKEIAAQPESVNKVKDERFKIEKIERISNPTTGTPVTRFSGTALPDIFITLYIYSDPIIITVKTDSEGNWTYDLDKELPDGNHEVYVAVTDNVGKITAQSKALPFVKTAQAINIQPAQAAIEAKNNLSPMERSRNEFIIIALVIALTFLGIGIVLIGRRTPSI